jgi:D-alanyl-lipoteichoic acid acyltransferase DltB (MBOAT superfamily)
MRWHMTLGRFLSHYVYIPLGGSRNGRLRTYANLMITFLVSGLWHGAGWTFILWGALHGIASMLQRLWNDFGLRLPRRLGRALTFIFVMVTWVFFRARNMADAGKVLHGMFLSTDFHWNNIELLLSADATRSSALHWLLLGIFIIFLGRNAVKRSYTFVPNWRNAVATVFLLILSVLYMSRISPFIYYNF